MKRRKFAIKAIGAALTALLPAGAAVAEQENVVILIDRSGSMGEPGNVNGASKWDIALQVVKEFVNLPHTNREYELWTFSGPSWTPRYTFADGTGKTVPQRQSDLLSIINALPGPTSSTPLAGTFCDAVDSLMAHEPYIIPIPKKRVRLFTDGIENDTPNAHPCKGPNSSTEYDPSAIPRGGLDSGSWEWKLLNKAITGDPLNSTANPPPEYRILVDVEELFEYLVAPKSQYNAASVTQGAVPTPFFQGLANETGGRYTKVDPAAPLPVLGDVTSDACVDYYDYQYVVNYWGQPVTDSATDLADLNRDSMVDYYDYLVIVQNWGNGSGC